MLTCLLLFPGKKKKKEETKTPVRESKDKSEEEKKREKSKAHAPSHAKIRSIGIVDTLIIHMMLSLAF